MARSVSRGVPSTVKGTRPETKGQVAACPDRTRAIPCKVRVSYDRRDAECARYVPDRPVNAGNSRLLPGGPIHRLTCVRAG
jgi:hypothetical protein